MKIGFISDLHIDLIKNIIEFNKTFLKIIRESNIEILVIPGDVSETLKVTIDYIKKLNEELDIPVYYVPGNHDMWYKNNKKTTQNIYKIYAEDKFCLIDKPLVLKDNIVIIGDLFWYDYSFANNVKYTKEDLALKTYNRRTWQDYFYTNWVKSDEEQCGYFINKNKSVLEKYKDYKIILVSHMINHKRFSMLEEVDEKWGYFNGFLGSESLYNLIKKYNIDVAVCGHIHFRRRFKEDNTTFICSCLGYEKEWSLFDKNDISIENQIRSALEIVEI